MWRNRNNVKKNYSFEPQTSVKRGIKINNTSIFLITRPGLDLNHLHHLHKYVKEFKGFMVHQAISREFR